MPSPAVRRPSLGITVNAPIGSILPAKNLGSVSTTQAYPPAPKASNNPPIVYNNGLGRHTGTLPSSMVPEVGGRKTRSKKRKQRKSRRSLRK